MKSKIKVALIIESWGKGGTEAYVSDLIRYLNGRNIETYLLILNKSEHNESLPDCDIRFVNVIELIQFYYRVRPDVVSLNLYTSLLKITILTKIFHIPLVTTLHMPLSAWGIRHRIFWSLAIKFCNTAVGVSKAVVNEIKSKKKYIISGAVNNVFFDVDLSCKINKKNKFIIAAVGRLSVEKDWQTLIGSVALLPAEYKKNIVIKFFGDGVLRNDLSKFALQKKVNVEFNGFVDKAKLAEQFALADLSVLPSRFEGLGLSAIEGMAVGVPTITANFPAAQDFIRHGLTGHIFPVGDIKTLSKLIGWHVENIHESKQIGLDGRKFVQQVFSEDVTYSLYLDIFNEMTS